MKEEVIRRLIRFTEGAAYTPDRWVLVQDPDTGALIPVSRAHYEEFTKDLRLRKTQ